MTRYGVDQCTLKTFDSRSMAAKSAGRSAPGVSLRPFRCATCGLWHLTAQTRAERRQRKKALREEADRIAARGGS